MIKHTFLSFFKDLKAFLGIKKERLAAIEKAPTDDIKGVFGVNRLASDIHPEDFRAFVICKKHEADGTFLVLKSEDGSTPVFKPGQYAAVKGTCYPKMFFITEISDGTVTIFTDKEFSDSVNEGGLLTLSLPEGHCYYEPLRDSKSVYLCFDKFGKGAEAAFSADGNVNGFLKTYEYEDDVSLDAFIKNAAEEKATVFIFGNEKFVLDALRLSEKNGIIRKNCRYEIISSEKPVLLHKEFLCKVAVKGELTEIPCFSDEPISVSLYNAGIPVNIKCGSGKCGYCRIKLVSGEIKTYFPEGEDPVRMADKKYSFIHPCRSYPLSDISLSL